MGNRPSFTRSLEFRLATLALVLGVVAAIIGDPTSGSTIRINADELARMAEGNVDRIDVRELGDWIIQQRSDYRLVDVRGEEGYAEYHIPTAEPVAISELIDYPLGRDELVILYSDNDIRAAQAWFLLKANGFAGAYMLEGGLNAWKDRVLFPTLSTDASVAEQEELERVKYVSQFFGGAPRIGGGGELAAVAPRPMPKVEAPSAKPRAPRKKKAREGC